MRLFFSILSIAYIAGIFLLADSSVVSTLSSFNPYSLLHIPLYGILTFLLIFSFVPLNFNPTNQKNQINQRNQRIQINFYLIPGGIALAVAIADEINQAYVPGRDASITDVLLDLVGIALVLFFSFRFLKNRQPNNASTH
jgi:VanZ family protein